MKLTCIIIDDEPLALEVLDTYISRLGQLTLEKKFDNALEAVQFINEYPVDLIFLDIQMPDMNGIELLNSLANPPLVIFTTAHRKYAVEGYDLNIIDFLLKPVSFERMVKAVNKAMDNVTRKEKKPTLELKSLPDEIFLQSGTHMVKVIVSTILYLEGMKDYIQVYTANQRIIVKETMKNIEKLFLPYHFMRVHKSYIVSLSQITVVTRSRILIGKKSIPIGRNYQELITQKLRNKI